MKADEEHLTGPTACWTALLHVSSRGHLQASPAWSAQVPCPHSRLACTACSEGCLLCQVAVHVEADEERLTGPTACWTAEPPDPVGVAFNPVHGFTTQDVMRDQRFRVSGTP